MTWMSRSARSGGHRWAPGPASPGRLWAWSVVCIALGAGCLYVEPTYQVPENRPPELYRVNPSPSELYFDNEVERISVIAADPEGDELTFVFQTPPFVVGEVFETNEDGVYVFTADIPWSPEVDGAEVALTVLDQDPVDRGEVTVEWRLVVP